MGVRQFTKTFGTCAVPVKDICDVIANKRVIIDVNIFICASIKAMRQGIHLTDKDGVPTAGIKTLLNNIIKYEKCGARVIGIFDNPNPNPRKHIEYEKRRCAMIAAQEKATCADNDDDRRRHESNAWRLTDAVVHDAQQLLHLLGITYFVAPIGCEAEQYAANLIKDDRADIIITNDTDALMFGAPNVIMVNHDKMTKRASPWIMFKLDTILHTYGIDMPTFQKMCVMLGTDFAHKTSGVGPKTVLTAGKHKHMSPEQEEVLKFIQDKCDLPPATISNSKADKDALICWLVESKGFNPKFLQKLKTIAII